MPDLMYRPGERATYADVARVSTPKPTKTWNPIPHTLMIDMVKDAIDAQLPVTLRSENYALARGGSQFFGVLQYNGLIGGDTGFAVGLRGSHDKSISRAGACGAGVFVCSNLCFSGDGIVVTRKHTKNIVARLDEMVGKIVGTGWATFKRTNTDLQSLKGVKISNDEAYAAFGVAFGRGWLTASRLTRAARYWDAPPHAEHKTGDLWAWYNACNHALKTAGPEDQMGWHARLHAQAIEMREGTNGVWSPAGADLKVVEAVVDEVAQ